MVAPARCAKISTKGARLRERKRREIMTSEQHREWERRQVLRATNGPGRRPPVMQRIWPGFSVSQAPRYEIPSAADIAAGRERERQLIAEAQRVAERNRR